MGFYIYSGGKLLEHEFAYLKDVIQSQRLEPTLVPGRPTRLAKTLKQKEFFVIEYMSSPVSFVTLKDSLSLAYEKMNSKQIRHLPVLDDQDIVCGLISDRDLIKYSHLANKQSKKVKEIMSSLLICVHEETDLRLAAHVLIEEKISSLAVVNENLNVSGILTTSDILKAFLNKKS